MKTYIRNKKTKEIYTDKIRKGNFKLNVLEQLKQNLKNSNIYENEDMRKHTSFKIGGTADYYIKVKDLEDVKFIMKFTRLNNIPLTIIGNGSNLLVKDNGIRGITINIDLQEIEIQEPNENGEVIIKLGAGVKLGMLARKLADKEIEGFEFASGIPGTIGGAIRMNAGAYGKEFKEIIQDVTYLDLDGNLKTLENNEINFSYRHSRFITTDDIIISSTLKLKKGNKEEILDKMKLYQTSRKEKQPIDMPSAGSTFKRGTNYIAAQLIDEAGLKGYSIGGAQVSTKHAGFIVNTGKATAKDVLDLIEYIIKVVYEKYGKILEMEIEIVGE